MAITTVPKIDGPSYGGIIYGLSLEMNYSEAPSKLTLNIVNKNGVYQGVKLNQPVTITIGKNFKFLGTVWGYSIEESASEKILNVEIIDNSIKMDQRYVMLWKKNFFDKAGTEKTISKEYDLSDEFLFLPTIQQNKIVFKKYPLGIEKIDRKSLSHAGFHSNVYLVGQEKFKNTNCDIPSTYYTLADLNSILGEFRMPFAAPKGYNVSHEGTLRNVISAWCQDFGYSWYWDFSEDRIRYFDLKAGIATLPNYTNKEIVKKIESESLEGTYAQHSVGYIAMPKQPVKNLSGDGEFKFTWTLNPYPVSYFLRRSDVLKDVNFTDQTSRSADKSQWGGRTREDFLKHAFLGYINPALRSMVLFSENHWKQLGIEFLKEIKTSPQKQELLTDLKQLYKEDIQELEKIDAPTLPNFNIIVGNQDLSQVELWFELEKEILGYHGRFYRQPNESGTIFYCSDKRILEINTQVTPENNYDELNSREFSGSKIYQRQGSFSHSSDEAELQLALTEDEMIGRLQSLQAYSVDLVSSNLLEKYGKASGSRKSTFGTQLWLIPNKNVIQKVLKKFETRIIRAENPMEVTWVNNKNSSQENKPQICSAYEDAKLNSSCEGSEEEARRKQTKKLANRIYTEQPDIFYEGLETKRANGLDISIDNKKLKLMCPSDGQYRSIITISPKTEQLDAADKEVSEATTTIVPVGNVAKLNVVQDNFTDPLEDEFRGGRRAKTRIPPTARAFLQDVPEKSLSYTFAGFPSEVAFYPSNGLFKLDIQYSAEGVLTTAVFQTRPKQITEIENFTRKIQSQFNKEGFNST